MEKTCIKCKQLLPITEFHRNRSKPGGRQNFCRQCAKAIKKARSNGQPEYRRWEQIKRKYGMTQHEWEALFKEQDECCAICKTKVPGGSNWHTDHCHDSGKVRGILCCNCNQGLGQIGDNNLIAAVFYLQKHRQEESRQHRSARTSSVGRS